MELYAVKYGVNFKDARYDYIFRGNQSTDLVPGFIFLYYIAKYNNKVLLFDTGFRSVEAAKYYGVDLIPVEDEVKTICEDTNMVDGIFITHAHFDHTDNLDLYPNSKIYISKAEYEIALKKYQNEVKDVLLSDKVQIVQEDYLYEDKFLFKVIGGHTEGSAVIYFEEAGRNYVIAGDECYSCENVEKNIPNAIVYDGSKNESFIQDAHDRKLITLPYHDNKIFMNYTAISENIVRIL